MLTAAAAAAPLEAPQARVGEPVAISMEQKCPHVYQSEARCLPRRALDEWGRVAATGTQAPLWRRRSFWNVVRPRPNVAGAAGMRFFNICMSSSAAPRPRFIDLYIPISRTSAQSSVQQRILQTVWLRGPRRTLRCSSNFFLFTRAALPRRRGPPCRIAAPPGPGPSDAAIGTAARVLLTRRGPPNRPHYRQRTGARLSWTKRI